MGFITILSREAGAIAYGTRMVEQDRVNLSVQVDLGNCLQEEYVPTTDVTEVTDSVIWFENNFYIPDGVAEFSFVDDGVIHVWTWNVDTWDETTATAVAYTPTPGPITEISDGVTHNGTHFIVPTGVTAFTFEDDGVEWTATFSVDTWIFDEVGEPAEPTTMYVDTGATGEGNGTSWEDAYTNLQAAFNNLPTSGEWDADVTILCRQSTEAADTTQCVLGTMNTGEYWLTINGLDTNGKPAYLHQRNAQFNRQFDINGGVSCNVRMYGFIARNTHAETTQYSFRGICSDNSIFDRIISHDVNYGIAIEWGVGSNLLAYNIANTALRCIGNGTKIFNATAVNSETGLQIVGWATSEYGNIYLGGNTTNLSLPETGNTSVRSAPVLISDDSVSGTNIVQNVAYSTSEGAMFVNITEGSEDFRVKEGSSLIDAGDNLFNLFETDIEGNERPNQEGESPYDDWTVGAYEGATAV